MRVLHVTPSYWPATELGGPVRADRLLVGALHRAGVEVEVITTDGRGSPALPRLTPGCRRVDGVPVTYCRSLGAGSGRLSAELALQIGRRVRAFDLVHLHGIWTFPVAAAALACWRAACPYLLTPQGCLQRWPLDRARLKKRAHLVLLGRRVLRRAAALHYTSEHERRTTASFVQRQPSFVVPNAVEPLAPVRAIALPAGDQPPRVLFVGRVNPIKGLDLLIPAMAQVRRAVPAATLELVGPDEGAHLQRVRELAGRHGLHDALQVTGMVGPEQLSAIFARSSLLAAPSRSESFCMAAAEAMGGGLPVVISDQVGLHDAVRQAHTGLVVPCEVGALAAAIVRLLLDEPARASMGRRGQELVERTLAPGVVGEAMIQIYRRIVMGE